MVVRSLGRVIEHKLPVDDERRPGGGPAREAVGEPTIDQLRHRGSDQANPLIPREIHAQKHPE